MTILRAALLGSPVLHSLSPKLHSAAGRSVGIDVDYLLKNIGRDEVSAGFHWARSNDLRGLNLTAPLKTIAGDFVDELCPIAKKLGAINTVILNADGTSSGTNTDVYGFVHSFVRPPAVPVLVLGAGGAARAVVQGCIEMGVSRITVLGRRIEQARLIAHHFGATVEAEELRYADDFLSSHGLLVNALPPTAESTFKALRLEFMLSGALLYDLNYGGREAILRSRASEHGFNFMDGLPMLVHQGIRAFELWTGRKPDFETVRNDMAMGPLTDDAN